ncbi:MAG: ABC transporter permease [Oceanospirillaceae bacterium]|nr:ABC transporter permease [Oceanospirillaceae bacterium]
MPAYATTGERFSRYAFLVIAASVLVFLIAPVLIIMPLSFNAEPYFTFTQGMLSFDPSAYSMRWYLDILHNGMKDPAATVGWWSDMWNNAQWIRATRNSFFIATVSATIATFLGTLAALGLSRPEMPQRALITSLLISPMIVPLVITATGMFFFYSSVGIAKTYTGVILAHVTLGVPFVIITVTATLSGFDMSLVKAAQNMGANGWTTFRRIIMPLILPGMISGALFAFITSLDEVVAVLFIADVEQRTIPRQMFSGIREQISPTILAVASILVVMSVMLLTVLELLRRRSERLRGMSPG